MRILNTAIGLFGEEQLQELLAIGDGECVSIYLPSPRVRAGSNLVPLRLVQLLDGVEAQLVAQGYSLLNAQALLKPARSLPLDGRAAFGQKLEAGVALFLSKDFFAVYHLPIAFAEQVNIGHRFALRPLLPLLNGDGVFHLLAMSENQVKLFRGSRFTMAEVALRSGPHSLAETLRYDEFEKQRQSHTTASGGLGRGKVAAVFHGQGDAGDSAITHKLLLRFLHEVDDEITPLLAQSRTPLVLAGVDSIQGLYRTTSHYPLIAKEGIVGNPDRMNLDTLHDRAWAIVAPDLQQPKEQALEQLHALYGREERGVQHHWRNVLLAAQGGQVAALFVTPDANVWGSFDEATVTISVHEQPELGDEDLVEAAVAYTLRNGGVVYEISQAAMPHALPTAALLRTR